MAKREPAVTFKGTMAELTSKLTLNGKKLSQPFLSQLVTYGLSASVVAKQPNSVGKGKPTNIVEVTSGKGHIFAEIVADAAAEHVDASASTEVTA
jgi:hypothetical protein